MICDHELSEMETACVDGRCPLCMSSMLARKDAEIERLRALSNAYRDYAILLEGAESRLLGLATAHGYKTPPEAIERGEKLRAEIDRLNQQLTTTEK